MSETQDTQRPAANRLLTNTDLAQRLNVSRVTLVALRKQPDFPKPLPMGGTILRWHPDQIDRWEARKMAEAAAA